MPSFPCVTSMPSRTTLVSCRGRWRSVTGTGATPRRGRAERAFSRASSTRESSALPQ